MKNRKGLFIVFEGPDGSGKTTILNAVAKKLNDEYKNKIVLTREPGGTKNNIGEEIRKLLLESKSTIDYHAEALLFAASRSQHISDFIIPNLDKDNIILCDRYVMSSLIYQGLSRKLGMENVYKMNEFAMHGILPNLTIVFMVSPKIAFARMNANRSDKIDRFDKEKEDFKMMVFNGYKSILKNKKFCKNTVMIDADIDDLEFKINKVYNIIKKLISKSK